MTLSAVLSSRVTLFYERRQPAVQAAVCIVLAILVLLVQAYLGAFFGAVSFIWLTAVTIAALFISCEFVFALLITNAFLQNAFLALASPSIPSLDAFRPLQGGNFLSVCLTAFLGIPVWLKLRRYVPLKERQVLTWMVLLGAVVVIYSGVGFAKTSPTDVLTYTRVDIIGGLMLLIGIAMGFQISATFIVNVVRLITIILVTWGVLEFFCTPWLYRLFNVVDYIHLQYANSGDPLALAALGDIIRASSSQSYLNLSGKFGLDFDILRLQGPNIHSISYAYGLAFCALVCFAYRSTFLLVACLLTMSLVGGKGPILMVLVSLVGYPFYKTLTPRLFLTGLGVLCAVVGVGVFIYGILSGDYHVIGLLGGLRGFMHDPLGRGVGIGGNLSHLALVDTNFKFFESYGADFALESAFGVMLYQIGIGALVFFAFYWQVWKSAWRAIRAMPEEPRLVVLPVALAVLFVNGFFQEEVLSPEGWGLMFLFAGLVIAWSWQRFLSGQAQKAPA